MDDVEEDDFEHSVGKEGEIGVEMDDVEKEMILSRPRV